MSRFTHSAKILIIRFWQWLVNSTGKSTAPAKKASEFEKAVLIEKYGFNRYL
ncbi:MAG: hypothetical protein V6Z89_04210 [Desulfobacter sp.]